MKQAAVELYPSQSSNPFESPEGVFKKDGTSGRTFGYSHLDDLASSSLIRASHRPPTLLQAAGALLKFASSFDCTVIPDYCERRRC